ncbi:MAG: hypothetical protein Q9214_000695 [Letrouitia sp. 1 TL-2023]
MSKLPAYEPPIKLLGFGFYFKRPTKDVKPLLLLKIPISCQLKRDPSVIFGTPLAGPSAARRRAGYGESPSQSGLERPREPDNCCMSGCVNCVWDAYREEVEAWAERIKAAATGHEEIKLGEVTKTREIRARGKRVVDGTEVANGSAGRATNLREDEHLFDDVPVGIREFMATEKRLREKREARMERG